MKFLVFSRSSYCPFCEDAKELLKAKGYQFEEVVADQNDITKAMFREHVNKALNEGRISQEQARTVPQVFVANPNLPNQQAWIGVGGYSDLVKFLDSDNE